VGLVALCVQSLWWPRIHDAGLMEYVAWTLRHGGRPYQQIFDMNLPGAYLFSMAGQMVLGTGDVHVRILDLLMCALLSWSLWRLLRPYSVRTRWLSILLVLTIHVAVGGPPDELERDWLVGVLILVAVALLFEQRRKWPCRLLAGAILGFAVMIKPQALMAVVAVPYFLLLAEGELGSYREALGRWRQLIGRIWKPVIAIGLAALVVIVANLAWVKASGDWTQFSFIIRKYLPLYSRLNGQGLEQGSTLHALVKTIGRLPGSLGPVNLVSLLGVAALFRRRRDPERQARVDALVTVAVIGVLHAVSEFKLFRYHFSVFQIAGLALLAIVVVEAVSPIDRPGLGLPRSRYTTWAYGAAVVAVFGFAAVLLIYNTVDRWDTNPSVADRYHRTVKLASVMKAREHPGDRVQVLDEVEGGDDAALRAGLKPGTRFIYDFNLYHDQTNPVIKQLRQEYVSDFEHNRPRFVIVYRRSWGHRLSYADLNQFPELVRLLKPYKIIWHDSEVRLLERTTPSGPAPG
jgi:hypothetical protein